MCLAVPLRPVQIAAANRLHGRLRQWAVTDRALLQLQERFPGFGLEACLLKVVAVNALYATNVLALMRMAEHVTSIMAATDLAAGGPELVEQIMALPRRDGLPPNRAFASFASKFAHFFIDPERFPVYDRYAAKTLGFHLRGRHCCRTGGRYERFIADLGTLEKQAGLSCSYRDLDHYLWLTGQYRQWLKERDSDKKPQINTELAKLFSAPSGQDRKDLDAMLPRVLPRAF